MLEAPQLGQAEDRLPQAAVAVDEHPRPRVADAREGLESALDVGEVRDGVHHHDHVERSAELSQERRVRPVPFEEVEVLAHVCLSGGGDGARGKIHADAVGRGERRQEVPRSAADVQDSLARRDAPLDHAGEVVVEVASGAPRPLDPLVVRLVEPADLVDDPSPSYRLTQ